MLVTPSGMLIDSKLLLSRKASSPIFVTPSPITYFLTWKPNIPSICDVETMSLLHNITDVRLLQSSKARAPMLVMFFGIVTDVRPLQP